MNPLKQEQIRLLDAINCKDLRCKIDEIVKHLNKTERDEVKIVKIKIKTNICNGRDCELVNGIFIGSERESWFCKKHGQPYYPNKIS